MALYHVSLMKGKKSDGSRIKAVEHVKYINREEKYADADREPDNLIRVPKGSPPLLDGKAVYLYKSGFGDILNTPEGLRVSGNASPVTVGIAMMIAKDSFDGGVTLAGSPRFKDEAIRVAADCGLPIEFADPADRKAVGERNEERQHERERFRQRGGKIFRPADLHQHDPAGTGKREQSLSSAPTFDISSLRELSERGLDGSRQRDASVLLHDHAYGELEEHGAQPDPSVRWDHGGRRRGAILKAAQMIRHNLDEFGESISAVSHVQYINREAAFRKKGGCIYTAHRLPKWAKEDPKRFFRAADQHERKDGNRYLELQMALPNELTLEQNLELIQKFIERELPNQYYTFAIHDKIGAMSDGTRHLHIHLMFTERSIDDAEREKERTAKKFFSRPVVNPKNLEEARRGGAKRDRRFNKLSFIPEVRATWAEITNEILEKYGCPDRVDHRSLKEMKKEAEAAGDKYLARILDRTPERSLGPVAVLEADNEEVKDIRQERKRRGAYHEKIFRLLFAEAELQEMQLRQEAQKASEMVVSVMELPQYHDHQEASEGSDPYLDELRQNFEEARREMRRASRTTGWSDDILAEAEVAFLPKEEQGFWHEYEQKLREYRNWKTFSESIDTTDFSEKNRPYLSLVAPVERKLEALRKELAGMQGHREELEKMLLGPVVQDRLHKYVNRRMQEERPHQEEYRKAVVHLVNMAEQYRKALLEDDARERLQDTYGTRELYGVLRRRYYGWKKELARARKAEGAAKKAVITLPRATKIAENVWSRGEWKKLRTEKRALAAQHRKLDAQAKAGRDTGAQLKELLAKEQALEARVKALETRMEEPAAKMRIREIAAGVMRKNRSSVIRYEAAKRYTAYAKDRLEKNRQQMLAVKEQMKKDPRSTQYKVVHSGGSAGAAGRSQAAHRTDYPSLIAEAIQNQPRAVQVVARSTDSGLQKDWIMMTDFERDEELEKQILRDL